MIPLENFLRCIQENAARIHGYELGHDGSDGKCDCIGLIIGALGLAGFRWPGVHGSNWAARNAMRTLEHIADAGKMFLGEIVYKAKEPGEDGYSLPDRYQGSGDVLDYYHVGVVTGVDPLQITHCTSRNGVGGVYVDNTMGNWRLGGMLKYVDYDEQEEPDMDIWATVYAETGKTVNMRKEPDKKSTIISRVPVGEKVEVLEEFGGWCFVTYGGKSGYMMREYLLLDQDEQDEEPDSDTVNVSRETLEEWEAALLEMAEAIRGLLGQG